MNGYRGLMAQVALREKKEQQAADRAKEDAAADKAARAAKRSAAKKVAEEKFAKAQKDRDAKVAEELNRLADTDPEAYDKLQKAELLRKKEMEPPGPGEGGGGGGSGGAVATGGAAAGVMALRKRVSAFVAKMQGKHRAAHQILQLQNQLLVERFDQMYPKKKKR